jgi:hypothetical protein
MIHKGLKTELESLINYPLGRVVSRVHGKNWWRSMHYMIIQPSILFGKMENVGNGILQRAVLWEDDIYPM